MSAYATTTEAVSDDGDEQFDEDATTRELRNGKTVRCCDWCGKRGDWYPLGELTENRGLITPPGRKFCRECAKDANIYDADCMTDAELIAAIVSQSYGYAGPHHAAQHVSKYRKGKEATEAEGRKWAVYCERGGAEFNRDLEALIDAAVRHWLFKSHEERERLLENVEKWRQIEDEDRIASMAISMGAPVGGI